MGLVHPYLTLTFEVYVLPAITTETVFVPAVTVYLKAWLATEIFSVTFFKPVIEIAADFHEAFAIATVIERTVLPLTVAFEAVALTVVTIAGGTTTAASSPVKWNSTMSAISVAWPEISG